MKDLIEDILNHFRIISDRNSAEHREFIHNKLEDHRRFMAGYARYSPYVHPDEWEPRELK